MFPAVATIPLFIEDELFLFEGNEPLLLLFADDDGVDRFVVELFGFCPVADAALETKFLTAFPRLSKVDPDLWLSVVLFEFALYVGVS